MSGQRLCLVDASLYIFRAWHSLPPDWRDADGWPTHAAQGYASFLLQVLEQLRPQQIAVCFDEALGRGFRHDIYPAYKANRERPDEALLRQFAHCQAITRHLGVTALAHQRYEADDLIGSLVIKARGQGQRVLLLSADKDLTQLLRAGDEQWDFGRDRRYTPETVVERFGVRPEQIADLLALSGDAIDNIPGVHGVGQLTAAKLLRHFGSLEALYQRVGEVAFLRIRGAKALHARLIEQQAQARLSQQLTTIACDAPVPALTDLHAGTPDLPALNALFDQLGFGPFLRRRAAALAGTAR